jgi:hypothetical protein
MSQVAPAPTQAHGTEAASQVLRLRLRRASSSNDNDDDDDNDTVARRSPDLASALKAFAPVNTDSARDLEQIDVDAAETTDVKKAAGNGMKLDDIDHDDDDVILLD